MVTHNFTATASTAPIANLEGMRRRIVVQRHPVLFPLIVLIAVASPFLGLVLNSWIGVGVGFIINIIALIFGFRAIMKIVNEYEFRA